MLYHINFRARALSQQRDVDASFIKSEETREETLEEETLEEQTL